jgi:hypothetical protein
MALNLDTVHPDWKATREDRVRSQDLYAGTSAVKAKTTTYLFKGANELSEHYAVRLARAVLSPWVEKIVHARQAVINEKPASRNVPVELEPLLDDIDGKGTSAQVFFEDIQREAQVSGAYWVLVDMPPVPEGGYVSKAAEVAAGHRVFFSWVPADNVIDWEVGENRELSWAVIRDTQQKPRESAGSDIVVENRWRVWTRTEWFIYTDTTDVGQKLAANQYRLIAQGQHGLGAVPLVPFLGLPYSDFAGFPVAKSVLDMIVLLYNKQSDLDWFEYLAAHPIPVVIAPKKPERIDAQAGLYIDSSQAQGVPVECKYLETSGAPFDALRTSIASTESLICLLALAQAKRDGATVEAADTQREYRRDFKSGLRTQSQSFERAEKRCWELAALWTGANPESIEITYSRDFNDRIVEAQMLATLGDLADAGRLTNETLLTLMKESGHLPENFDIEDELKKLMAQRTEEAKNILQFAQSEGKAAAQ